VCFSCTSHVPWYFPRSIHSEGASHRSLLQTSVHFPILPIFFCWFNRASHNFSESILLSFIFPSTSAKRPCASKQNCLYWYFLELKLLIQCIELTYFFTNNPKSVFALFFLSAWGCIHRLRSRTRIHILDHNYRQAQRTGIICNDLSTVLKFELVS